MNALLKRVFGFALLGLVALAGFQPGLANAQAVVCVNCSTFPEQLIQYAQEVEAYEKQVQQYTTQLQQYANMIQNTKNLPFAYYDNALNLVRNVENTLQQGTNVSYALGNLNGQFLQMYPNLQTSIQQANFNTTQGILNGYMQRSQQSYDSARTLLLGAQQQSQSMSSEQSIMDATGGQLINANGRFDAIQAAGVYAQNSAQQLMKLRELILMQIQLQATVQADTQRQKDADRAELIRWVGPTLPAPTDTSIQTLW